MKAQKWDNDELKLSKRRYEVAHVNTISLAEQQRFIALGLWPIKKPLLPEEWVVVRMRG